MNDDFEEILQGEPAYRVEQIYRAWFDKDINGYNDVTNLPIGLREKLSVIAWMPAREIKRVASKLDGSEKSLLELIDGVRIETVLMRRVNKKINATTDDRVTACLSTQAGCAMNCQFCATGSMGLKRSLSMAEIIAQFRYWHSIRKCEIDNVVLMGQGEPFLNYDNVKRSIELLIKFGSIGPRKITLSTVGIAHMLDKMVADMNFPAVRLAISLHSAINETRKQIIPSHKNEFFDFLISWSKRYHLRFPSRTHFLGLEYILFKNLNDDDKHLKALVKLASKMGSVRINLLALNCSNNLRNESCVFLQSADEKRIKYWQEKLMQSGFITTIRFSQGQDIAGACGQLSNEFIK